MTNTTSIEKIADATEQLTQVIVAQQAAKKAREEVEARLCKSGAIDDIQWCINQGHEVPQ